MGFINDMLNWEQSGHQRKLKRVAVDQVQVSVEILNQLIYQLNQVTYQSARARDQVILLGDIHRTLEGMAEDLARIRAVSEI